jgi:SAM-dependent methyltransferase
LRGQLAKIDPVALMLIAATSGYAYKHLVGSTDLRTYPIPALQLPACGGQRLLDIGCSWGRWSISAARLGYEVVGIDPSLGAVMAARRITSELGLDIKYIVGDGRFLPFPKNAFDCVYSYSVLQHFSNEDVRKTIAGVNRVLRPEGVAKIQMANKWGIRSLQHQALRRFREPSGFDVRYYGVGELAALFRELIGTTRISTDCYFGLGWQWSDFDYMPRRLQSILIASEALRRLSNVITPLRFMADSVFCMAVKPAQTPC